MEVGKEQVCHRNHGHQRRAWFGSRVSAALLHSLIKLCLALDPFCEGLQRSPLKGGGALPRQSTTPIPSMLRTILQEKNLNCIQESK